MHPLLRAACLGIFPAIFFVITSASVSGISVEERFASPPADARIHKIIHGWPDKPEAQDKLIGRLQAQGFGGVVCNVSFAQYMESEPKWTAFVRGVEAARKAGFALWLYDECGYPSGNAGGITLRGHPEWEASGLLVASAETKGGTVALDVPPGKLFFAAAHPVSDGRIDLTRRVDLSGEIREGRLNWRTDAGTWCVMVVTEGRLYEGTHAEGNLHAKIPYINLLMPEPTERFLDVTYGNYAKRLGGDLGSRFMATFTDEPSLMSWFLKTMPYRPLPWSPNLPVEFAKRRGYALDRMVVPALIADAGPAGEKIRYDFWLTVGELVSENFFGRIQQRCREHNIPSGGHLLAEEGLVGHTPLYGDFFRCIRRLDAPSIDCLTSLPQDVPWHIARLLASAAELEGHSLVMSETSDHSQRHRSAGDKRPVRVVTEEEIRGTCNRLIVGGVNDITSYYSYAGLSDEQCRRLNDWVGRCCTMLRGGHQVADIAVLYPTESVWTKFVPSRHTTREAAAAARVENSYRGAADSLFTTQRDFTFVDSKALTDARVEEGALVHGQLRWRVVVLPRTDTMPEKAWQNLARLVEQGGVIVALGAVPRNSEREFPSAVVQKLGKTIFGDGLSAANEPLFCRHKSGGLGVFLPAGLEGLLPHVLEGVLEPDVKVHGPKSPVRAAHRRIDGREVYFLINDSAAPWDGTITFAAAGVGERWDPGTGRRDEVVKPGGTLHLGPYGAMFVRFPSSRTPAMLRGTPEALPSLGLRALPKATPVTRHGQYVRGEVAADTEHSTAALPAWRVSATLTEGNLDTHQFAQFRFAVPADLSSADCVAIDSWVPEGQRTPNRILVILHEEGGGDFLADTGRSLSAAGVERSFIPLERFHLAGWSKDSDGVLDLKRVSEIRVGWGGYFGAKDERVQFSVAIPQAGVVRTGR